MLITIITIQIITLMNIYLEIRIELLAEIDKFSLFF